MSGPAKLQKNRCGRRIDLARRDESSRTVYTTSLGRICPECGQPVGRCVCKQKKSQPPAGDGIVRVRVESKGRGGKKVTTISGVPLSGAALKQLASDLKRRFGAGGAVKDGVIEVQGDHADELVAEMKGRGFTVKRAGG